MFSLIFVSHNWTFFSKTAVSMLLLHWSQNNIKDFYWGCSNYPSTKLKWMCSIIKQKKFNFETKNTLSYFSFWKPCDTTVQNTSIFFMVFESSTQSILMVLKKVLHDFFYRCLLICLEPFKLKIFFLSHNKSKLDEVFNLFLFFHYFFWLNNFYWVHFIL